MVMVPWGPTCCACANWSQSAFHTVSITCIIRSQTPKFPTVQCSFHFLSFSHFPAAFAWNGVAVFNSTNVWHRSGGSGGMVRVHFVFTFYQGGSQCAVKLLWCGTKLEETNTKSSNTKKKTTERQKIRSFLKMKIFPVRESSLWVEILRRGTFLLSFILLLYLLSTQQHVFWVERMPP